MAQSGVLAIANNTPSHIPPTVLRWEGDADRLFSSATHLRRLIVFCVVGVAGAGGVRSWNGKPVVVWSGHHNEPDRYFFQTNTKITFFLWLGQAVKSVLSESWWNDKEFPIRWYAFTQSWLIGEVCIPLGWYAYHTPKAVRIICWWFRLLKEILLPVHWTNFVSKDSR